MNINKSMRCPKCSGINFCAKFETTYVYSYDIDTSILGKEKINKKALPFLFDNRSQSGSKQYIECKQCGKIFPCSFTMNGEEIDFTIIQKAIRSEHVKKPHYWG